MNQQFEKISAKAYGQMTVLKTAASEEDYQLHREFLEKYSKLLIEECVNVIDGMRFTDEGPSENASYQRTLCGVSLKEYFGLTSKGPISSRNIP